MLLISGFIAISFWKYEKLRLFMAAVFGIGAALVIDEFALWLYLQDVYWEKQGRDSVDAVIITIAVLTIIYTLSEIYNHYYVKKAIGKLYKR